MVYELEKLSSDATVIAMHSYEDVITLFDTNYTLYRYDESAQLISKNLILSKQEPLHKFNNSVSFAPVAKRMMILYGDKPMGLYLDILEKPKLVQKITEVRKSIEITTFSPQGSYFAIGDASGRSNIFHAQTGSLVTSVAPRPDYIAALKFSSNERFLVSSSYDKSTTIFDTVLNVEMAIFQTKDVVESITFFDDDHAIALLQRNGAFVVYDMNEGGLDNEKNLFPSWPTSSVLSSDGRHLLVGMKNGSLSAVNLEHQERIFDETLCSSGITGLSLDDGVLMASQENKTTLRIDVEHKLEAFEDALKVKEHHKLKDMIGSNIFLILSKNYDEEMIELYEPLFKKIHLLIEKGEIEAAKALVEPYENDPKIMHSFELLVKSENYIKELATLVKEKKIVEAYILLNKYHILRDTPAAVKLEQYWQQTFNKAKALCKKNDPIQLKEAERLLSAFKQVAEKQQQIHALLKNIKIYIQADEFISKKQFKAYLALVAKAPFLAESEVHRNIIEMSQKILLKLKHAIKQNEFQQAKDLLNFLMPFTNLKEALIKEKTELVMRINFFDALQKNDISSIFSMAKEYPLLRQFSEYEEIEDKFKILSKQALDFAFKADAESIFKLFEPYRGVKLFEDKIASLVKVAFINEMRLAADNVGVDWSSVFIRFMSYFGRSDELLHLAGQMNQLDLLRSLKTDSYKQGYKKYELPTSILS